MESGLSVGTPSTVHVKISLQQHSHSVVHITTQYTARTVDARAQSRVAADYCLCLRRVPTYGVWSPLPPLPLLPARP